MNLNWKELKELKNERIKWWIEKIKENWKRKEKGWIYYDMQGNSISREEAHKLYQVLQQKEFSKRTGLATRWDSEYQTWNVII